MSQLMDVIVIGCGASGIAALRRLHDAGLKVMGLEAADRIGGRIHTVQYGECALDIGAAWCHGEKDNIVFEMANPLNLLGRPNPDNKYFIQSNGDLVPDDTGERIQEALADAVNKADKNNTKSISQCVRDASKTNKTLQADPELSSLFVEWYERNNHVGGQIDPRHGKSLKGLEESWGCEGEFMLNWKGRGYKTILDVLLKKHADPSQEIPIKILTNTEVESIKWKSQFGLDSGNPLVQIKCKDGSLFAAKSVIVTVSIGVLKERWMQLFNPPLPANKINSITNLQFCILNKIYIQFTEPWWPKHPSSFTILWRQDDKDQFSENERWVTEIYGFNTVEHQPYMLLAWIYGEGAKIMEERSLEDVEKGIKKLLKVLLSKQFNVTPVKSIIRSQWATNPLVRGAYAYRSVASEENGGNAVELSEPLYFMDNFPIVCFAGEATSQHRHSAVHGAIEAGFREADRLINAFRKNC